MASNQVLLGYKIVHQKIIYHLWLFYTFTVHCMRVAPV